MTLSYQNVALLLVVGEDEDVFAHSIAERKNIHIVWLQLSMQTDLEKKKLIVLKIQFVSV